MTVSEANEIYEKIKSLDAETRRWFITALFQTVGTEETLSADSSAPGPERRTVQ